MIRAVLVFAVLCAVSLSVACSTAPEPRPEGPVFSPTLSPMEAVDAAGPWLPAESSLVGVISGPDGWEGLEHWFFPLADGPLAAGEPGTAQGLRDDLNALFEERLGFGLLDLHTVVAGGGVEGVQIVAFGDLEITGDLNTVESGAGTLYELPLRYLAEGPESEPNPFFDPRLYILPIEEPRRGLVFSISPHTFEGDLGLSVASGESFQRLVAEVEDDSPSVLLAALPGAPLDAAEELPTPESFVFSLGSSLTAVFAAPDSVLDEMEESLASLIADGQEVMAGLYGGRSSEPMAEAVVIIYGHHLLQGAAAQLVPRRGDGVLTYELELSERGWLSALLVGYAAMEMVIDFLEGVAVGAAPSGAGPMDERTIEVAVAAQRIPAGTTLTADLVVASAVPIQFLPANPLLMGDLRIYEGITVMHTVEEGQMLLTSDFTAPGMIITDAPPEDEEILDLLHIGDPDAPVEIVVYVSLQCPFSGRLVRTLEQLQRDRSEEIYLVVRPIYLEFHEASEPGARAVLAAQRQGMGWEMMEAIFTRYRQLAEDYETFVMELVGILGLDEDRFLEDWRHPETASLVRSYRRAADAVDLRGTPTFVIGDEVRAGDQPYDTLEEFVDQALSE